jgi:hypothetical protein
VCQLLAGYRETDQVTLVMEYMPHDDFHTYCTNLPAPLIAACMIHRLSWRAVPNCSTQICIS